jgi:hypothetical protein
MQLVSDKQKCFAFGAAASSMGKRNADQHIAELILKTVEEANG